MPCQCGKGTFEVERWVPDHPYPTNSVTFRERINCAQCSQIYQIVTQNGDFCVVDKQDVASRDAAKQNTQASYNSLRSSPEAKAFLAQLAARIDQEPSKAAKYRLLQGAGLVHETQGTFTKNWPGAARHLDVHCSPWAYRRYAAIVGGIDPALEPALKQYELLARNSESPLPVVATLPRF